MAGNVTSATAKSEFSSGETSSGSSYTKERVKFDWNNFTPVSAVENNSAADTDESAYNTWRDKLGIQNPITTDDGKNNADTLRLKNHFNPYVNGFKDARLWIGTAYSKGDWHDQGNNGILTVNPRVRLYTDSQAFTFSYDYELGDVSGGKLGGIMSKFDDLVDTARVLRGNSNGATWISKYQNPKVFKNVTEIKSDGNLKFVFTFGQAGLFSGLEEVVKPIIAIAGMFAPQMVKSGTNGVGGLYSGPLPTPAAFTATMLKEGFQAIVNTVKDQLTADTSNPAAAASSATEKPTGFDALVSEATSAQVAYKSAINAGSKAIVANSGYGAGQNKLFFVQIGQLKYGPCTVKSIKWNFDMTMTDEFGYPTTGYVELSGIETFTSATREAVVATVFDT